MNRVPMIAPCAPSASAAMTPRPSVDAARRHDRDLHRVDHLRHQRERADLARVAARLRPLRRHDVGARRLGTDGVLHLARHHHDLHPVPLHLADVLLGHGEAGHEDAHLLVEEDGQVGLDHLRNRRQQVDREGTAGEPPGLADLLAQAVGREVRRPHDAETAGIRHRCHQRRHRHAAHAGKADGHLDAEEVADRRAKRGTVGAV